MISSGRARTQSPVNKLIITMIIRFFPSYNDVSRHNAVSLYFSGSVDLLFCRRTRWNTYGTIADYVVVISMIAMSSVLADRTLVSLKFDQINAFSSVCHRADSPKPSSPLSFTRFSTLCGCHHSVMCTFKAFRRIHITFFVVDAESFENFRNFSRSQGETNGLLKCI